MTVSLTPMVQVWISVVLMTALLQPTLSILQTHFDTRKKARQATVMSVSADNNRSDMCMEEKWTHWESAAKDPTFSPSFEVVSHPTGPEVDMYANTLAHSRNQQNEVAKTGSTMLVYFIFGSFVPPLFFLAPLNSWLNLCALRWNNKTRGTTHFGETLAVCCPTPCSSDSRLLCSARFSCTLQSRRCSSQQCLGVVWQQCLSSSIYKSNNPNHNPGPSPQSNANPDAVQFSWPPVVAYLLLVVAQLVGVRWLRRYWKSTEAQRKQHRAVHVPIDPLPAEERRIDVNPIAMLPKEEDTAVPCIGASTQGEERSMAQKTEDSFSMRKQILAKVLAEKGVRDRKSSQKQSKRRGRMRQSRLESAGYDGHSEGGKLTLSQSSNDSLTPSHRQTLISVLERSISPKRSSTGPRTRQNENDTGANESPLLQSTVKARQNKITDTGHESPRANSPRRRKRREKRKESKHKQEFNQVDVHVEDDGGVDVINV